MSMRSLRYELADVLLNDAGGVRSWVLERRLRIRPMSWERIAAELAVVTDGRVRVTGAGLRLWFVEQTNDHGAGSHTQVVAP